MPAVSSSIIIEPTQYFGTYHIFKHTQYKDAVKPVLSGHSKIDKTEI